MAFVQQTEKDTHIQYTHSCTCALSDYMDPNYNLLVWKYGELMLGAFSYRSSLSLTLTLALTHTQKHRLYSTFQWVLFSIHKFFSYLDDYCQVFGSKFETFVEWNSALLWLFSCYMCRSASALSSKSCLWGERTALWTQRCMRRSVWWASCRWKWLFWNRRLKTRISSCTGLKRFWKPLSSRRWALQFQTLEKSGCWNTTPFFSFIYFSIYWSYVAHSISHPSGLSFFLHFIPPVAQQCG